MSSRCFSSVIPIWNLKQWKNVLKKIFLIDMFERWWKWSIYKLFALYFYWISFLYLKNRQTRAAVAKDIRILKQFIKFFRLDRQTEAPSISILRDQFWVIQVIPHRLVKLNFSTVRIKINEIFKLVIGESDSLVVGSPSKQPRIPGNLSLIVKFT